MTRKRSHWREINGPKSWQLRIVRDVLMEASAPMTQGDVRRELERLGYKDKVEAIPTVIWEIGQNKDAGYATSGGLRFPDGQYRYWLIAAPGWTPRWIVTKDFKVVPAGEQVRSAECEVRNDGADVVPPSQPHTIPPSAVAPPRLCLVCDLSAAAGSLFCGEACEEKYWATLTGKKEG